MFRSAQSSDYDGLIGADVFSQFVVKIDFVRVVMALEARLGGLPQATDEPMDWTARFRQGSTK